MSADSARWVHQAADGTDKATRTMEHGMEYVATSLRLAAMRAAFRLAKAAKMLNTMHANLSLSLRKSAW
jgi:hypothetical protein